jgi:hypothetical protein
VETNQPTAGPTDELQRKLGDAERSLSAHLVYENGVPSTRPEHLDPIVEALEDALKALKSAKSKSLMPAAAQGHRSVTGRSTRSG